MLQHIPGADGTFELRNLINPGACPQCGEFVKKMWYYMPNSPLGDRFLRGTAIVMSCEECAEREGK